MMNLEDIKEKISRLTGRSQNKFNKQRLKIKATSLKLKEEIDEFVRLVTVSSVAKLPDESSAYIKELLEQQNFFFDMLFKLPRKLEVCVDHNPSRTAEIARELEKLKEMEQDRQREIALNEQRARYDKMIESLTDFTSRPVFPARELADACVDTRKALDEVAPQPQTSKSDGEFKPQTPPPPQSIPEPSPSVAPEPVVKPKFIDPFQL